MIFKINFESHFDLITTDSSSEALKLIEENSDSLDAVISDMRMPEMDGVELIRKAHQKFDGINYYILSGFNFDQEIEDAVDEKIVRQFFTKPFNQEEILQELSA